MSADRSLSVLLVEDNPGDALHVRCSLQPNGTGEFDVAHVSRLSEALGCLATERYDAIVLDMSLPDAAGLDLLNKVTQVAPSVPVVVLSGFDDEGLAVRAVQEGAQDFLVKGRGDGSNVARAIRYAIERKRAEEALAKMARLDTLTGLQNRAAFDEALPRAMSRASRSAVPMALLFIDLDHFKFINDEWGHEYGDRVLRCVARRMTDCVRRGDTVTRHGGDEFAVILEGLSSAHDASTVARKLIQAVSAPLVLDGLELPVSLSVGVALYPGPAVDGHDLARQADRAMYLAKQHGRNTYRVYGEDSRDQGGRSRTKEQDLRLALERGEFRVYYQPQLHVDSGRVHGVEALVRWQRPDRDEVLSPADFLGLAEDSGLIVPLGEWVLRTACTQNKAWQDQGLPAMRVAVNLSGRQFDCPGLKECLVRALDDSGLHPSDLELELTETVLAVAGSAGRRALDEIREMGVRISIDDFGTGYASLSHLRELPIDAIKIDRTFVKDLADNPADAAIVSSIIVMAHRLGLKTIAEGVETPDQLSFLESQGCDEVQGYLVSAPLPAGELAGLLAERAAALPAAA